VAPIYHQFGLNLCVADYRGYGASGGVPSFSSLISDAYPVLDWFHDVLDGGAFTGPRFVMGRSLGAHPALEIAARRPERLSGVIIESGAGNLRRLLRYVGGDQADHAATELVERHARKIGSIQLPMLVIHGAEDELIPVEHVIDLHDSLRTTEKEILIIPGAGHNDIMWVGLRQYFEALATSFVGRHS
jgi:pimeloyl-ACP methyl ester carboxylesterase